jgi:hypothetical protein
LAVYRLSAEFGSSQIDNLAADRKRKVAVIHSFLLSPIASSDHMIEPPGIMYSGSSGHEAFISKWTLSVNSQLLMPDPNCRGGKHPFFLPREGRGLVLASVILIAKASCHALPPDGEKSTPYLAIFSSIFSS